MTELLFREAVPLNIGTGDYPMTLAHNYGLQVSPLITIYEADLCVEDARALRDWLNKVLPPEQQTYGLPDFSPIFGGASSDPKPGECGCYECSSEIRRMTRMITCSQCGNKRCPHATNHIHACTNSNEAGQPGSRYQ